MKLPEGNVFSRVCQPFCPQVEGWPLPMMHWTSLYRTIIQPWSQSPLDIGPHCQGTNDPGPDPIWTLNLTVQGTSSAPGIGHRTSLYTTPPPPGVGAGAGPGLRRVPCLMSMGLYSEVQCIIGSGHILAFPCGQNDRQTRLKTLPSQNFVGGQ